MRNVAPRIVGPLCRVAEDQPQYTPVTVIPAVNPNHPLPKHNAVIMCFEPSADDRQRIINGENLYIALLTNGLPQQPILITIGPEEMAARHGLSVKERHVLNIPAELTEGCAPRLMTTCLIEELVVGDQFKDVALGEWFVVKELRNTTSGKGIEVRVSKDRGLTYNRKQEVEVIKP